MKPKRQQWWMLGQRRARHGRGLSRSRCGARAYLVECLEARSLLTVFAPKIFADGGNGSGSLRAAIVAANADPGHGTDVIQLSSGRYSLTLGQLEILTTAHNVTIQGRGMTGPGASIIDANGLSRVLQLAPGTQLTLQGVEIKDGLAHDNGSSSSGPTPAEGGGILDDGGALILDEVLIDHNTAEGVAGVFGQAAIGSGGPGGAGQVALGGGLYVSDGTVRINNSVFDFNSALGGAGGDGGDGRLGSSGRSFAPGGAGGNGGAGEGGGVYVAGGSLSLNNAIVDSDTARGGVGGDNGSAETSSGSTIRGNQTGAGGAGEGGGMYVVGGVLSVNDVAIGSNIAEGGAGGALLLFPDGVHQGGGDGQGGGLFLSGALAGVNNTSVTSNIARGGDSGASAEIGNGGDGMGGGVYNSGGSVALNNVAVSSDFAQGGNDLVFVSHGGDGEGGGLCTVAGTVTLLNAVLTRDAALGGSASFFLPASQNAPALELAGAGEGGGLFEGGGTVSVANSLVDSDTALGGAGAAGDTDFNPTPNSPGLPGGSGGAGLGGGLFVDGGSATVANTLIVLSTAQGGVGGTGGINLGPGGVEGDGGSGGPGAGGGVFVAGGSVTLRNVLVSANTAKGGEGGIGTSDGSTGTAADGGLGSDVSVVLILTWIADNQPDDVNVS